LRYDAFCHRLELLEEFTRLRVQKYGKYFSWLQRSVFIPVAKQKIPPLGAQIGRVLLVNFKTGAFHCSAISAVVSMSYRDNV
jgi:hypothetical protein